MESNYELGPFRLDAKAELLFRGTEPIALGQRAVALLRVLVERAGVPVSKEVLIEAAWPGLVVEESNLTVQIAALRRVLEEVGGDRWIETLQRRGYRYVGPVVAIGGGDRATAAISQATPALALPNKPSVAALPFTNLSGDRDQEYFADGMVEDIITGLSRIKWLFVVARNSSFTYKGQPVTVKQVGRELGVRYLLEGSVRKAGTRVRISAQLVEAETGSNLWAERYERPLDDIFAVQDEITLSVVGAIEPSLREAEIARVKRKRPDSLDAYDLVLRALPHVYLVMPEEATKALPLLEKALALEADYADAHGFLAWCHEILFVRAGLKEKNRAAAVRHARAAVTYGRDNATALALGAFVIAMVEHDRVAAFQALDQALALSPSSSFTLFLGSVALAYAGEAERAIEWGKRSLRISPFDRLSYLAHQALTIAYFMRGGYEDAATAGRLAVQSSPGFSVSHSLLAAPLAMLGRREEARAAAMRVLELQPSFSAGAFCAALQLPAALGKRLTEAWHDAGLPP
jgi:TolB-like protein/Flp pilus assembly protein TadD